MSDNIAFNGNMDEKNVKDEMDVKDVKDLKYEKDLKDEMDGINLDETNDDLINTKSLISQRMTIAGVFFDIALFVADVEHLKFTMDWGQDIKNYGVILGLLITSLSLQVIVGALLFMLSIRKTRDQSPKEVNTTRQLNHLIIGLVSIIALINICATIFGDRGDSISQFIKQHNCTGHVSRKI